MRFVATILLTLWSKRLWRSISSALMSFALDVHFLSQWARLSIRSASLMWEMLSTTHSNSNGKVFRNDLGCPRLTAASINSLGTTRKIGIIIATPLFITMQFCQQFCTRRHMDDLSHCCLGREWCSKYRTFIDVWVIVNGLNNFLVFSNQLWKFRPGKLRRLSSRHWQNFGKIGIHCL